MSTKAFPSSLPVAPTFASSLASNSTTNKSKKPNPVELLALYKAKGLNLTEASHQEIHDLQSVISNLLYNRARSSDRSSQQFSSQLDPISTHLSLLEMKVDTKPGMAQTLALGVSVGALVQAMPHVLRVVSIIWSNFRNFIRGNP